MNRIGCKCDRVRKGEAYTVDQCPHCWNFWHRKEFNLKRGGDGNVVASPSAPLSTRTKSLPVLARKPCPFEGPVVEGCTSCDPDSRERNHVRTCLHPDAEWDRCTRGGMTMVNDVQGCQVCQLHPDAPVLPSKALAQSGSDKVPAHGYGPMYDALLAGREVRALLEIGVLMGNSIRAWRKLYPDARIVAADIDPACAFSVADLGVEFVQLDAGDPAAVAEFAAVHAGQFDVIVDDASHLAAHQLLCRSALWPTLRTGGLMVIEDVVDEGAAVALEKMGGQLWDTRKHDGLPDDPFSRCVTFVRVDKSAPVRQPDPVVLFAFHDLSLSGAPIALANILPHLRGIRPTAFSFKDGPLRSRLEAAGIPVRFDLSLDGVDLVWANTLLTTPIVRAARDARIPCVWWIHESDPEMCGNLAAVKEAIQYPRALMFPHQSTADAYREWTTGRAVVVNPIIPPVPVRTMNPDGRGFAILTVGRDEPRKGQADIRAAIQLAAQAMEDVRFHALSEEPNPWAFYQEADLYICSSRVESFPLSLQEALAYGVPIITTPVFGCAEIVRDGIDGLHYRPGDVMDLQRKINQVRAGWRPKPTAPHLPTFAESVAAAERIVHGDKPRAVYHVAGLGWWKPVVSEQLAQLAAAGLTDVLATHVGAEPEWLVDEAARLGVSLTLCSTDPDVTQWERPAMRLMERLARASDEPILYLHSKGVSHNPQTEGVYHDWRRLMMRELVGKWREYMPLMYNTDLVGVNWWDKHPHFSGNFWLARADWIRRLPQFDSVYTDRYTCERWIGLAPAPRVKPLVCHDVSFWIPGIGMNVLKTALEKR